MPDNPSPAFAPYKAAASPCRALDGDFTCNAASGHALDHAAYGMSESTPVHTWPQLVSEVSTLAPEEMTALIVARRQAADGGALENVLALRLVAIVDRLAGITTSGDAL